MYIKKGYRKPQASPIDTEELCEYGCNTTAKFIFTNNRLCCSSHHNSCAGKRQQFSDRTDHKERAIKSLETRTRLGITKSSREKARKTMTENGTYQVLREKMQEYWLHNSHQNNVRCPLLPYKELELVYQGTYEYEFLNNLELEKGLEWIKDNVKRGPSLWYTDTKGVKRLYISDFIIGNTIYEIKSAWTWSNNGENLDLEENNKRKLDVCIAEGYKVILVLDKKEIEYER